MKGPGVKDKLHCCNLKDVGLFQHLPRCFGWRIWFDHLKFGNVNSFLFLIIFNLLIKLMQDNLLIDVLRFWPSAPEIGEKSLSRLVLFLGKDVACSSILLGIMVWFSKSDEEVVVIRRMVLFGQGISCSCDEKNGLVL